MNNLMFNTASSRLFTTINNASVTVAGTVALSNTSVTVAGTVALSNTSVTVAGTVAISNATMTVNGGVNITGHTITANSATLEGVTDTGVALDDTDISQITNGTFFLYNTNSATVSVSLQVSPTADDAQYVNDPDNENIQLAQNQKVLIVVSKYGHFARLQYHAAAAATFSVHYSGQM